MGDTSRVIRTVPQVPPDLFMIYSTAPGTTASDGTGRRNSPFAEAFLNNINSTEPLTIMVGHITSETMSLINQRQRPFTSQSMSSENIYYSLNPAAVRSNPSPTTVQAPESVPAGLEYEIVDGRSVTITKYTGYAAILEIPASIRNLPVTVIGAGAFFNCSSLTSITMPSSITSIATGAFTNCSSLISIVIPSSVTSIGDFAFLFPNNLTSVSLSRRTQVGHEAFPATARVTYRD